MLGESDRVAADRPPLASTAGGQADARPRGRHVLPVGMYVDAHLGRAIWEDRLRVGDTVSASVVRWHVDYGPSAWFPSKFTVLLRRDSVVQHGKRRTLTFTAVRARVDATAIGYPMAEFSQTWKTATIALGRASPAVRS